MLFFLVHSTLFFINREGWATLPHSGYILREIVLKCFPQGKDPTQIRFSSYRRNSKTLL